MRRDKWHFAHFDEFQTAMECSIKECSDLHKINELILALGCIAIAFMKIPSFFIRESGTSERFVSERFSQSLMFTSFLESIRNVHHTVYLSACGLYSNAYHNVRYALEFMVQSFYIDSKYLNEDFPAKIEILKRIENNYSYQGRRLVNKLTLDETCKGEIKKTYGHLSEKVHSTHEQFLYTAYHFMDHNYKSVYVDCNKVSDIYNSMTRVYDFFFVMLLTYLPELREPLAENTEFVETMKKHDLYLSHKVLKNA
jgi:hypothetical protein